MAEAQSLDILLESARHIMGITPETRPVEFMGNILHYEANLGQLPLRLDGGAERKCALIARRLVHNAMYEEDDLFGGGRYVTARLSVIRQ